MSKRSVRTFLGLLMAVIMMLSLAVIPSSAANAELNKSSVSIVKGYSVLLEVMGTNKKIKWSSADTSVAEVSKRGRVTGVEVGTTTVSASFGDRVLKCSVTVKAGSISANANSISIDVKKEATVSVKAVGIHELAVKSSDSSVAKASLSGKFDGDVTSVTVQGVADGSAKIKIYAKGYEKSIYRYINVKVGKGKPTEKVTMDGVTVSADSVEVNENLTAEVKVTASSSVIGRLRIISTAKHKFDVETNIGNNSATVKINGFVEGGGNLRIYDPENKKVNIYIPVTVTNNTYDVVVWNREPKKRTNTDIVYEADNGRGTKYYILEPKDADPAHAASLLAKEAEKYEYWTVYESKPVKELANDTIISKSEKYNGKRVTRYLLVPYRYDEAYSNSHFGMYFGVYDYNKVYANMPTATKYGDTTYTYECTFTGNGTSEFRFILTEGRNDSAAAEKVWKAYIKKYNITIYKFKG